MFYTRYYKRFEIIFLILLTPTIIIFLITKNFIFFFISFGVLVGFLLIEIFFCMVSKCPRCGSKPLRFRILLAESEVLNRNLCPVCGLYLNKKQIVNQDGNIEYIPEYDLRDHADLMGSMERFHRNGLEKRIYDTTIKKSLIGGILAGIGLTAILGGTIILMMYAIIEGFNLLVASIIIYVLVFSISTYYMTKLVKSLGRIIVDDEGICVRHTTYFMPARYFTWWELLEKKAFVNYYFDKFIVICNKRGIFMGVSLNVEGLNGLIEDVVRCAGEDHVLSQELLKHRKS